MGFWTDANFEPKMAYRWGVELSLPAAPISGSDTAYNNLAEGIPGFFAKTVTKPAISYSVKEYSIINRKIKYPGNVSWEPITITYIDTIDGKVTKFINNYFNEFMSIYLENSKNLRGSANFGTDNKSGFDYMSTPNKDNISMLNVVITHYNADGEIGAPIIERWTLTNAFIRKYSSSQLDYGSDNLLEYTLEIEYDWAYLEQD